MSGMQPAGGGAPPAVGVSGVGRIGQAQHGVLSGAGAMPMHLAAGPPLISGMNMASIPNAVVPPMLLNIGGGTQNLHLLGLTPAALPIQLGGSPSAH